MLKGREKERDKEREKGEGGGGGGGGEEHQSSGISEAEHPSLETLYNCHTLHRSFIVLLYCGYLTLRLYCT